MRSRLGTVSKKEAGEATRLAAILKISWLGRVRHISPIDRYLDPLAAQTDSLELMLSI